MSSILATTAHACSQQQPWVCVCVHPPQHRCTPVALQQPIAPCAWTAPVCVPPDQPSVPTAPKTAAWALALQPQPAVQTYVGGPVHPVYLLHRYSTPLVKAAAAYRNR